MSEGWRGGSSRRWRLLRAKVLERDRYRCQIRIEGVCRIDAPLFGGHVHHMHGKAKCAGCRADWPTHLQAACAPCNLYVGEPTSKGDPPCNPMTNWTRGPTS
jgi:5-methylcytosine-specific restriction endonuclease McrA